MNNRDGSRNQTGMTQNPGAREAIFTSGIKRGYILPGGVKHADAGSWRRTQVDVGLYGGRNVGPTAEHLMNVPMLYPKINKENGEEWTPEPGDYVAVAFFDGNLRDPVVIGYLGPPDSAVFTPAAKRVRSYRKRSGTSEEIDKDGNRTTIIQGHETVTVNTGDVMINVTAGKATITVKGKTVWTSEGTIEHIGVSGGTAKGNVQGDCICAYTGGDHPMVSASVKSSK